MQIDLGIGNGFQKARDLAVQCTELIKATTDPSVRELLAKQRDAWLEVANERATLDGKPDEAIDGILDEMLRPPELLKPVDARLSDSRRDKPFASEIVGRCHPCLALFGPLTAFVKIEPWPLHARWQSARIRLQGCSHPINSDCRHADVQ